MNEYNNLIEEFDNLNIMDKRDEIIAEIKELFSIFEEAFNSTLHPHEWYNQKIINAI